MPQRPLFAVLILAILPVGTGFSGCAKRSSPGNSSARNETPAANDALLEVSRSDATPVAPPSLAQPGAYQGPPLKPRSADRTSFAGETVTPPEPVLEATSSSSSSDEAARRELLESEASSPGYVPPTMQIDPARLFRSRDEWTVAETAADALGRIGAPATADVLPMLDDPSPEVRRRGAEILAHIGGDAETAIEPLIRMLERDPDEDVRKAAAYALGQMGPKAAAAVPALARMLREGK
jgi:HEAT repeat protein